MPTVQVPGARLHYERSGSGEPLLWITGFAISSRVFEPILDRYTADFDTITYDNRGAGRSSAPYAPTSMPQLAGDAVRLLDHLGVESAHVYGLSMGGMVAQELALRWPERVRGLVLAGTSPGGPRAVHPELVELAALALRRSPLPARVQARLIAGVLFSEPFRNRSPQLVWRYLSLLAAHPAPIHGAAAHLGATLYHDTTSRLPRLQAPTLVLHGDADRLCPPGNAELMARLIPGAEVGWLRGAGHAAFLEQPEQSHRLFTGWLERHGPIAAGTPLSGLSARAEPLTRALGLPLGALRTSRSLVSVTAARAARRAGL